MKLWERKKLIETEWGEDSQANFERAIRELEKEGIPYRIRETRQAGQWAKNAYLVYSLTLDALLIFGGIWALLNLDRILN